MIITVTIHTLANVLETVIIELSKERTVPPVPPVSGTQVFFKHDGHMNVKGPSVGLPRNVFTVLFELGQHVVYFFTERHLLDARWRFPVRLGGNMRKVAVRMIGVLFASRNALDQYRFDWQFDFGFGTTTFPWFAVYRIGAIAGRGF